MPLSEIILVITLLLTIALIAAGLCRNLPIPYSVFLVIIGLGLGWLARSQPQYEFLLAFELTPERVLFLFLPALIFESAFNLDARALLKELTPVITLAIPALLLSTAVIGFGLWFLLGLELGLALLFGALISATDPVAVINLFREIGAPQRLTVLVEGESLFNDATAIVLFNTMLALILAGTVSAGAVGYAALDFVRVFLGGILIGVSLGLAISMVLNYLHAGLNSYLIMSAVIAYAGFITAEHVLSLSGVMAVVGAALVFGAYGVARIPQESTQTIKDIWEVVALVCNALLFLLVGFSIDITSLQVGPGMVLVAVMLMLLGRAVTIYGLLPVAIDLFKMPRVTPAERHIMWWGGLKGGLAIAIVLTLPEDLPGRALILDLTLGVVLFSLLVNAPTVRPLIVRLGIDRLTPDEVVELQYGRREARRHAFGVIERLRSTDMIAATAAEEVTDRLEAVLSDSAAKLSPEQQLRRLKGMAVRAEMETLLQLYRIGLVQPYTFLDLRNILRRDREAMDAENTGRPIKAGLFEQLEAAVIRRLREQNWATGLLARYQTIRLCQRLQRDLTAVLMADSALAVIDTDNSCTVHARQQLIELYRQRRQRRCRRLQTIAGEYPEYYRKSVSRLAQESALTAAREGIEEAHHHGAIGAKAFVVLERLIRNALQELPEPPPPELADAGAIIDRVPLLQGLSPMLNKRLRELASILTFLPGDTVIAEGQRGDALYIIMSGRVGVTRSLSDGDERVAELGSGEFFGETALLGDHVRTASIRAETPLTVIRLSRRDVLSLAQSEHELHERLQTAASDRAVAADQPDH